MRVAAIIVAAGRGLRAGGGLPKQWRMLHERTVAEHTVAAFVDHPRVSEVILVLHPDDIGSSSLPAFGTLKAVEGGSTRSASVLAGLEAAIDLADIVLIHDVARPLVSSELIDRVLNGLVSAPGAAPALAVTDALWRGENGAVQGAMDRTGLYRAQTPQGFHLEAIIAAHRTFAGEAADDVEIALAAGLDVAIVEGEERNLKITTAEDFDRALQFLNTETIEKMDVRTGNGYDVHRFGPGDHVMLCGIAVPHNRGLQGHSDADVGLHTITDAIYGALAEGDIGRHFPPSDPQWKGAASDQFLKHAVALAISRGFSISNVDCTLVCEFPKIGPHADAMRARLSEIMSLSQDRISVKATTSERLGFTGRGEGIAALATVTLVSK